MGGIRAADATSGDDASDRYVRHVHSKDFKTFVFDLMTTAFACALMYFITKKTISSIDPSKNSKKTEDAAKAMVSRLGKKHSELDLDAYEKVLIGEVTMPCDINVDFKSIGGLDLIKSQLIETILIPLSRPELFARMAPDGTYQRRSLVAPPRGILFYGPPGTGKTMTAKAIARDSGATFINLRWSTVKNKWYGESQKLVRAVFSLAEKLAPSIIFIDEAECFLGQRSAFNEHSETNALKAEFMSLWDGLLSDSAFSKHVLVLCATNRPFDLDEAILRRMPRTFEFPMPDQREREAILRVLLTDEQLEEIVQIETLAELTPAYSGSDLKEWCRFAALIPIREILRGQREEMSAADIHELQSESEQPRTLTLEDFVVALDHVKASGSTASDYQLKRMAAGQR